MISDSRGSMGVFLEGFLDEQKNAQELADKLGVHNPLPAFALDLQPEPGDIYGDGAIRLMPQFHLLKEFLAAKMTAGSVIAPGGLGTIAYALEVLDLQSTHQTGDYRIAFLEDETGYWGGFMQVLKDITYQAPYSNETGDGCNYVTWDHVDENYLITREPVKAVNFAMASGKALTRFARSGTIPLRSEMI